jgi:hypothetical protein
MSGQDGWVETQARVFTCGWKDTPYRAAKYGHAGDYLVVFGYTVDGHYYSGEFLSGRVFNEGETFPLLYDPFNPEKNSKSEEEKTNRIQQFLIVIAVAAGFVVYEWLHRK